MEEQKDSTVEQMLQEVRSEMSRILTPLREVESDYHRLQNEFMRLYQKKNNLERQLTPITIITPKRSTRTPSTVHTKEELARIFNNMSPELQAEILLTLESSMKED